VAATERAFRELPPVHLYLDTDILIAYLVSSDPNHLRAETFLLRLLEHGWTTVYVSPLSWTEYLHIVTMERVRATLPPPLHRAFRLSEWQQPSVRQTFMQTMLGLLDRLLDQFPAADISITRDTRRLATDYMIRYNLKSQDAMHLACATLAGYENWRRSTKCSAA
jgi:predicted nucleic acid-binding protein